MSDSRDRDTFVVEGISVKAGMVPFVDSVEEDIFWMGSFGEDAVEVNWVEGESPWGRFLSRNSLAEGSSCKSLAIGFGMSSF